MFLHVLLWVNAYMIHTYIILLHLFYFRSKLLKSRPNVTNPDSKTMKQAREGTYTCIHVNDVHALVTCHMYMYIFLSTSTCTWS